MIGIMLATALRPPFSIRPESGYGTRKGDGVSENRVILSADRKAKRFTTRHPQVCLRGVQVDEAMAPLLEMLWNNGLGTDFSCQGDTWTSRARATPEAGLRDENSAMVVFRYIDDAYSFLTTTVRRVGLQAVGLQEGFSLSPMRPHTTLVAQICGQKERLDLDLRQGNDGPFSDHARLRAVVRFPRSCCPASPTHGGQSVEGSGSQRRKILSRRTIIHSCPGRFEATSISSHEYMRGPLLPAPADRRCQANVGICATSASTRHCAVTR